MESSSTPNNQALQKAFQKDLAGEFDSSIFGYGYFYMVERADQALLEKVVLFLSQYPEALNHTFEVRPPAAHGRRGSLLQHAIYIKKPITAQYLLDQGIDLSIKFEDKDPVKQITLQSADGFKAKAMAVKYGFKDIERMIDYAKVVRKSVWCWKKADVQLWAARHIGERGAVLKDVNGEELLEAKDNLAKLKLSPKECMVLGEQLMLLAPPVAIRDRNENEAPKIDPGPNFVKIILNGSPAKTAHQTLQDHVCAGNCGPGALQWYRETAKKYKDKPSPLLDYKRAALVSVYTTPHFCKHLNQALREDDEQGLEELGGFIKELMGCWNVASQEMWRGGEVRRRMNLTKEESELYRACKVGNVFLWTSFVSTTTLEDNAFGNVLFRISVPEKLKHCALKVWSLSMFQKEMEVLLKPNLCYKVKGVKDGDGVKTLMEIDVEVVSENH